MPVHWRVSRINHPGTAGLLRHWVLSQLALQSRLVDGRYDRPEDFQSLGVLIRILWKQLLDFTGIIFWEMWIHLKLSKLMEGREMKITFSLLDLIIKGVGEWFLPGKTLVNLEEYISKNTPPDGVRKIKCLHPISYQLLSWASWWIGEMLRRGRVLIFNFRSALQGESFWKPSVS